MDAIKGQSLLVSDLRESYNHHNKTKKKKRKASKKAKLFFLSQIGTNY